MLPRYLRNVPSLSEAECAALGEKRVLIVGCGGLGGHLADLLCRVGVGCLRLVDGDVFEETNLNRQLLSETGLIGCSKAESAAKRVARVNPLVKTECFPIFLSEENAAELVSGCDVVIDALDNIPSRRILSKACAAAGLPYVYGAVQGWVAQAAISAPGDGFIELLFPEGVSAGDKSVLSFTPALCAALQSSLCVKLLSGREVETGKLYYFDILDMELESIKLV